MKLNTSEIGILIAVRMKSSRLKSKALSKIIGNPLIAHLIERMKRVKNASKIILCTSEHRDDRVLLDEADKNNIDKFAGHELDVMKRFIDAGDKHKLNYIVRVTGDNPLTDPDNIDRMIHEHIENNYDFTKSEFLPLGVNAEVVSLTTLKEAHRMALDPSLSEYMTSYLKRPDHFNVHTIENLDPFFDERALIRLTVDFDEDLKVMNHIYSALYPVDPNFTTRDVLKFLDKNPHILDINKNMLEIPLPKIKFRGEKKYDKNLVIIGKYFNDFVRNEIKKIYDVDKYEIIGFLHYNVNLQYSLVDGIPTLGDVQNIERIKIKAEYFYNAFKEVDLNLKFSKLMIEQGYIEVKI